MKSLYGVLQVLGATYDLGVGGLAFDAIIRDYFAEVFHQTYKVWTLVSF